MPCYLLLLIVEVLMHVDGKQLTTLNPAPRNKPLGTFWCPSLQMGLSDYIAWKHMQIILADAVGFSLLFGKCFSLSRKCGECLSESVNTEPRLVVNTYSLHASCQALMCVSDGGKCPRENRGREEGEGVEGALQF